MEINDDPKHGNHTVQASKGKKIQIKVRNI